MRVPSVVALREYYPMPKTVAFTRFNVFLRDRFRCQYCGKQHIAHNLTFDHVVPRARGGKTSWENVVAACRPCNTAKDDKIIQPIRRPIQPTAAELAAAKRSFPPNYLHESWLDYLYWDVEIDP